MDKTYRLDTGNDSNLKRIPQDFDQLTGKHVIHLEYSIKASNHNPMTKRPPKSETKSIR